MHWNAEPQAPTAAEAFSTRLAGLAGLASSLERRESKPPNKILPRSAGSAPQALIFWSFPRFRSPHWRGWNCRPQAPRLPLKTPMFEHRGKVQETFFGLWVQGVRCSKTEARCGRRFWFVIAGGEVRERGREVWETKMSGERKSFFF